MDILSYTLKNLLVPIIIGLSTVYATQRFEQKKIKKAKEDKEKENLNKLESHYYKIISHVNTLQTLINESQVKYTKCFFEVKEIQKLLGEVNIDILPRELKYYCGYFIHSFDLRVEEFEAINNKDIITVMQSDLSFWQLQVYSSANLIQQHYVKPLKDFLGIEGG